MRGGALWVSSTSALHRLLRRKPSETGSDSCCLSCLEETLFLPGRWTAQTSDRVGGRCFGILLNCVSNRCWPRLDPGTCVCFAEEQGLGALGREINLSLFKLLKTLDGSVRSLGGVSYPRATSPSTNKWGRVSRYKRSKLALPSELGLDEYILWKRQQKEHFD